MAPSQSLTDLIVTTIANHNNTISNSSNTILVTTTATTPSSSSSSLHNIFIDQPIIVWVSIAVGVVGLICVIVFYCIRRTSCCCKHTLSSEQQKQKELEDTIERKTSQRQGVGSQHGILPRTHLGGSLMSRLVFSKNSVPVRLGQPQKTDGTDEDGWDEIEMSDINESYCTDTDNTEARDLDTNFTFLQSYIDNERWDSAVELSESERADSEHYYSDEDEEELTMMHPMSQLNSAVLVLDAQERRRGSLSPFSFNVDISEVSTPPATAPTITTSTNHLATKVTSAWSVPTRVVSPGAQSDMNDFVTKLRVAKSQDHELVKIQFARKPHELLGFSFIGGPDNAIAKQGFAGVYVTNLHCDGLASKYGRLRVGDRILEANGVVFHSEMNNSAITRAINQTTDPKQLTMTITRPHCDKHKQSRYRVSRADQDIVYIVETLELGHAKHGLGMTITGGIDKPSRRGGTRIVIANLLPGGQALMDGRLQGGDILVDVNGVSMSNVTHTFAIETLRQCSRTCYKLTIMRPSKSVSINKPVDSSYGFSVRGGTDVGCPVTVDDVAPGSIAALSGIREGDELLYCDNVDLRTCAHSQVLTLIGAGSNEDSNKLDLLLHSAVSSLMSRSNSLASPAIR